MNSTFISYSQEDRALASRLAGDLERLGIPYWYDQMEIEPGDNFVTKIDDGLRSSNVMCMILTRHLYENKRTAREEWTNTLARVIGRRDARIIPLKFDDSVVPPLLAARSQIDMRDYKSGLEKLVAYLDKANVYTFMHDFVRPKLRRFAGGSGGGKATVSFNRQDPNDCTITIDVASQDSYAGIYFESYAPVDVSKKECLCFEISGQPDSNRIEIKLEHPAKTYYFTDYDSMLKPKVIPLKYYADVVDLRKITILTVAMNDQQFARRSTTGRHVQEIRLRNVHFR